jgi:hypothetical protein
MIKNGRVMSTCFEFIQSPETPKELKELKRSQKARKDQLKKV